MRKWLAWCVLPPTFWAKAQAFACCLPNQVRHGHQAHVDAELTVAVRNGPAVLAVVQRPKASHVPHG